MKTQTDKQAQSFLDKFGIKFRATLSDSKVAPWAMREKPFKSEPHHFRVTLSKGRPCTPEYTGNVCSACRLTFDFWSSVADAEKGIKTVDAYSVLACISGDVNCPETFEDFCSEYGYEPDSIKSLQTFRRCSAFGKRLRAFFTPEEAEALGEIR